MSREYFADEPVSIQPKKSREYFEDITVVEKPKAEPVMGKSAVEMIPTDGYPKAPKPTVMAGEPSYMEKASMYASAVPATAFELDPPPPPPAPPEPTVPGAFEPPPPPPA
jgi:hypothetical protein